MLQVIIPATERFDESTNTFVYTKEQTLRLEHSLLSISKWESKWKKPFFSQAKEDKTVDETMDYIRCMTLNQNVDPAIYDPNVISGAVLKQIVDYLKDPMTATVITEDKGAARGRQIVTSELIYYWMFSFNIPIECEKWHINRLMTLIRVCSIKNAPPKKMSKKSIYAQNSALNAARRKAHHSRG